MKIYKVKIEERPLAKAFFKIAEVVSEVLEHDIEGDDLIKVTPETEEQEK